MKKLVLLLLFVTSVASAQTSLEVNQDGEFRIEAQTPKTWDKSDIMAEEKAMKYISRFHKVVAQPGVPLLIEESVTKTRLKLFFKKLEEIERAELLYDDLSKTISLTESTEIKETTSYFTLIGITSLIFMILSNVLFKRQQGQQVSFAVLASILAAILACVSAISSLVVIPGTAISTFALAAGFAAFMGIILSADKKIYWRLSSIYYMAIILHLILLFV